jgi:alanine-synthesizing transaminase
MYPIENDQQLILDLLLAERLLLVQGTGFNWKQPDHFRSLVREPVLDVTRRTAGVHR